MLKLGRGPDSEAFAILSRSERPEKVAEFGAHLLA